MTDEQGIPAPGCTRAIQCRPVPDALGHHLEDLFRLEVQPVELRLEQLRHGATYLEGG